MTSPAPRSSDLPELFDLVARLRRAGFRTDTRQYITAHDVLLRLAARGDTAADLAAATSTTQEAESARAVLTSHLGPIFCMSPEQQRPFAEIVRQWLRADRLPIKVSTDGLDQQRREILARRRRWRTLLWGAAAALALLAAGVAGGRYLLKIHDIEIRVIGPHLDDASAAPRLLPGAQVKYAANNPVPLDDSGRWRLALRRLDGDVSLSVTHADYLPREVTVSADHPSPLDIELQPPPRPPDPEPGSPLQLGRFQPMRLPDISPPPIVERHWGMAAGLGAAAGVATFIALSWFSRRRRRSVLRRMPADARSDLESFRFDAPPLAPLGSRELRRLIGTLRRQRELDSSALDVDRTVRATSLTGGLFTPVFAASRRMPEYVVLSERRSADDHYHQLVDSILDPLARNGVPLERYHFSGDASVCRRTDNSVRQFTIAELAMVHHDAVLWVFADTDAFFDPLSGQPARWVEELRAWRRRALFTPVPPYLWGEREEQLSEGGAIILPATADGLRAYGNLGADGGGQRADRPPYARRYPSILAGNAMRWLERESPAAGTIEMLVAQLRSYLGPSGFDWLAACAVYPQVSWSLTLDLAFAVCPARNTTEEFTALALPAVARLPWLRHAYMPDWLRRVLLHQLTPEAERRIRAHLDAVLSRLGRRNRAPGVAEANTLDITAAEIVATAPPHSPMRDAIFIGFTSGTNTPDLAVLAPRALVQLFRSLRRLPTPEEEKIPAPARSWTQRIAALLRLLGLRHPLLSRAFGSAAAAIVVVSTAALVTTKTIDRSGPMDGFRALALGSSGAFAAGFSGETIKLWTGEGYDRDSGRSSGLRDGPDFGGRQFTALALSADGNVVAVGGTNTWFLVKALEDNSPHHFAQVWDNVEAPVTSLALSADGRRVATFVAAESSGDLAFWTADEYGVIEDRERPRIDSGVGTVAIDPDGGIAGFGDSVGVTFFNLGTGPSSPTQIGNEQGARSPLDIGALRWPESDRGTPNAIAISREDRLAVAFGQELSIVDRKGTVLARVDAGGPIRAIAFNRAADQVGVLTDVSIAVWPIVEDPPDANTAPVVAGTPPVATQTATKVSPTPTIVRTSSLIVAGTPPVARRTAAKRPQRPTAVRTSRATQTPAAATPTPPAIESPTAESKVPPRPSSLSGDPMPNAAIGDRYPSAAPATVRIQPSPDQSRCVEVVDIRKLGWREGEKIKFCLGQGFDGSFTPSSQYDAAGYCYRGNEEACRKQAGRGASAP